MISSIAEFSAKFRLDELRIEGNDTWTWSLRPGQITLGASVLSLNRYAAGLSETTPEEALGLHDMVVAVEKGLKAASIMTRSTI